MNPATPLLASARCGTFLGTVTMLDRVPSLRMRRSCLTPAAVARFPPATAVFDIERKIGYIFSQSERGIAFFTKRKRISPLGLRTMAECFTRRAVVSAATDAALYLFALPAVLPFLA